MGLFSAEVKFCTSHDGAPAYQIADLFIVLYDSYLLWQKMIVGKENATIYYSDITAVTYSNGGMLSNAFLSISTPGRTYSAPQTCAYTNINIVAEHIEQMRAQVRKELQANFNSAPPPKAKNTSKVERPATTTKQVSYIEELKELKGLMDLGIITQEEFDAKKQQLLGVTAAPTKKDTVLAQPRTPKRNVSVEQKMGQSAAKNATPYEVISAEDEAACIAREKIAEEERIAWQKHAEENRKTFPAIREKLKLAQRMLDTNGCYTVGLNADGSVVAAGSNDKGQCDVAGWRDVVSVAAGPSHTLGLKADGTVLATKFIESEYIKSCGQCDVAGWTDIVAVAAGGTHSVGLKADGTVVATKYTGDKAYYYGQCDVSSWTDIVAVAAGDVHTVGLKADGTVISVGSNMLRQRDVSAWTDIVAIAAGTVHTVGLRVDGTVVATNRNSPDGQGKVDDWTDVVAIHAGVRHTVGLKADGTVVATKYTGETQFDYGQCDVSSWTDIVAVAAGAIQTIGLKSDGTIVTVGNNEYGQCNAVTWKLFTSLDRLESEMETQRIARQKREEEERIARQRHEEERRQRREAGLCQHCGGQLKGLFSKKCSSCGRNKDY